MRTGAARILVGVGRVMHARQEGVLGIGVPQATAIADARAARTRHLDETGVYVHVIADGGMATGGDIAKAIVWRGCCDGGLTTCSSCCRGCAGQGFHWGMATFHQHFRGTRVETTTRSTLENTPRPCNSEMMDV